MVKSFNYNYQAPQINKSMFIADSKRGKTLFTPKEDLPLKIHKEVVDAVTDIRDSVTEDLEFYIYYVDEKEMVNKRDKGTYWQVNFPLSATESTLFVPRLSDPNYSDFEKGHGQFYSWRRPARVGYKNQ